MNLPGSLNRLFVLLLLAACDPAVTVDYMGEPIGELHGTIVSEFPDAPPPAEVILAWINWHSDPGTVVGTRVPVEGMFPSRFSMTVHRPPPELALNELPENQYAGTQEPRVGFAWIMVLREGAAPPNQNVLAHADIKALRPGSVLGWSQRHIYVYIDRDAPEESWAEEILKGAEKRGFHLMIAEGAAGAELDQVRECKEQGRVSSICTPMIAPLRKEDRSTTEVEITLTPELGNLKLPVFALPDAVEEAFGIAPGGGGL